MGEREESKDFQGCDLDQRIDGGVIHQEHRGRHRWKENDKFSLILLSVRYFWNT